jgi:type II secretion system protein H
MWSLTSYYPDESRCRGLTIIELLVVVVILGTVAALAAPNMSMWMEGYTVRKSGRQLVSDLQLAKMRAVSQGVQHRISFDPGNRSYTIQQGNASSGSTTWTQVDSVRALSDEQNPYCARGVTLATNFANNAVLFTPVGTASPAGTVTLSTSNYTRLVRVILTGRVRVE